MRVVRLYDRKGDSEMEPLKVEEERSDSWMMMRNKNEVKTLC